MKEGKSSLFESKKELRRWLMHYEDSHQLISQPLVFVSKIQQEQKSKESLSWVNFFDSRTDKLASFSASKEEGKKTVSTYFYRALKLTLSNEVIRGGQ